MRNSNSIFQSVTKLLIVFCFLFQGLACGKNLNLQANNLELKNELIIEPSMEYENHILEAEATDLPDGVPSLEAQNILISEMYKLNLGGQILYEKNKIQNDSMVLNNSEIERIELPADLKHLDPFYQIPNKAFNESLEFFLKYRAQFKNQKYIGVIDFSLTSSARRLFLMDMQSGIVETYLVAHGKNSDPNFDGMATRFSNQDGSLMSSLGAYMVAESYSGKHGLSVRLDGLQPSNSNARSRAIVIHAADYVNTKQDPIGRSFGCPAVEVKNLNRIVNALKMGALLFASF